MAKIRPLSESMVKQVRDNYKLGFESEVNAKNPYDSGARIRKRQAWSAGHFDKWGRV